MISSPSSRSRETVRPILVLASLLAAAASGAAAQPGRDPGQLPDPLLRALQAPAEQRDPDFPVLRGLLGPAVDTVEPGESAAHESGTAAVPLAAPVPLPTDGTMPAVTTARGESGAATERRRDRPAAVFPLALVTGITLAAAGLLVVAHVMKGSRRDRAPAPIVRKRRVMHRGSEHVDRTLRTGRTGDRALELDRGMVNPEPRA